MKRILGMLIVLFLMYLTLQVISKFMSNGHYLEYRVSSENEIFLIKEKFINKKELSNYYFEIENENNKFYLQTFHDFSKADMIIKDIKYKKIGTYTCILPIFFGNKIIMDITCNDGKVVYNYSDLAGRNRDLDNWVNELSEVYSVSKFKVDDSTKQEIDKTTIYPNYVLSKHYLAVENYKGISTLNKINVRKLGTAQVFETDKYKKELSYFFDRYYLVADYDSKDTIDRFFFVDIMTNKKNSIDSTKNISFNSYIMGSVKNSVYLYDKDNKKQYQINVDTKKIIEVGNAEVGIKIFKENKWQWVSIDEAKKGIKFTDKYLSDNTYARIDTILGENGKTFYYLKKGTKYEVFEAPNRMLGYKKYVFSIDNIEDIIYVDNFVYFKSGNTIYYYSQGTGVKSVYTNDELQFNKTLKFGIHIDN